LLRGATLLVSVFAGLLVKTQDDMVLRRMVCFVDW